MEEAPKEEVKKAPVKKGARSPQTSKMSNKNEAPEKNAKNDKRAPSAASKKGAKPVPEPKGKKAPATAPKEVKSPTTPKGQSAPPEKGRRDRTPIGKKGKAKLKKPVGKDVDDFDPEALTWEEKRQKEHEEFVKNQKIENDFQQWMR